MWKHLIVSAIIGISLGIWITQHRKAKIMETWQKCVVTQAKFCDMLEYGEAFCGSYSYAQKVIKMCYAQAIDDTPIIPH